MKQTLNTNMKAIFVNSGHLEKAQLNYAQVFLSILCCHFMHSKRHSFIYIRKLSKLFRKRIALVLNR